MISTHSLSRLAFWAFSSLTIAMTIVGLVTTGNADQRTEESSGLGSAMLLDASFSTDYHFSVQPDRYGRASKLQLPSYRNLHGVHQYGIGLGIEFVSGERRHPTNQVRPGELIHALQIQLRYREFRTHDFNENSFGGSWVYRLYGGYYYGLYPFLDLGLELVQTYTGHTPSSPSERRPQISGVIRPGLFIAPFRRLGFSLGFGDENLISRERLSYRQGSRHTVGTHVFMQVHYGFPD